MQRHCPECREKIIGRVDKKFCGSDCRNAFHNTRNKDQTNLIRSINNSLRKNYRILSALNPEDKCKANGKKLIKLGFDFEHFTSIYTTKAGKVYYFVYDQGYLSLGNNYYALVRRTLRD